MFLFNFLSFKIYPERSDLLQILAIGLKKTEVCLFKDTSVLIIRVANATIYFLI
jgi:hypothetical protein